MDPSQSSEARPNANVRGTWAKRAGFKSNLSGESTSDGEGREFSRDLEMGTAGMGRGKATTSAAVSPPPPPPPAPAPAPLSVPEPTSAAREAAHPVSSSNNNNTSNNNNNNINRNKKELNGSIRGGAKDKPVSRPETKTKPSIPAPASVPPTRASERGTGNVDQIRVEPIRGPKETDMDAVSLSQDAEDENTSSKQPHMKYGIRETPGYVSLVLYGIQHFVSIMGSLVLIPLVIVPAMGGDDKDTAYVVSTLFLVSGISTLLHSFFGSRLPLIQGASFVYLAPALVIINSSKFASIGDNRFEVTMRELQGSIIVASIFQMFLGYSGLMALLLRLINPVVVAPTIAAVGLSFFTYGFPVVGTCIEIGAPQIVIIIFFALYLRKISIRGHRIFQVYAVPLGLAITWAYAFLLTAIGVYNYHGCDFNIPSSNIISESCREHAFTMQHCRTDASKAFQTAAWIRFPYPLQWGGPTFHYETAIIMIVVAIIASVDSVGTYHASSLLVSSGAPTPGVVSRGIGMEGFTSALAGLWGIGTGSTTLTENVHTIAATKMGSRRAVELGACVLIVLSFIGKVGAFIASIPQVIVAGLLCVMWAMLAALGLSNLRYSETGSSRNVVIVGLALFFSLSVPAFFQDYGVSPDFVATTSSYLQPYIVASHGPFNTSFSGFNFILNSLLSMNMVIAFVVAFILDNTVPGSKQERGVYVWRKLRTSRDNPGLVMDYGLPFGVRRCFKWVKWVGL